MLCCNTPLPSTDCCSPIDYNKTADLIKFCGFRIIPSVIQTIREGKCEAVTIGFKEGIPVVEITERGQRKRTYKHDGGKQAEDLVKRRIKKFYGEEDKPAEEEAWPDEPPKFIRPGSNNPFE